MGAQLLRDERQRSAGSPSIRLPASAAGMRRSASFGASLRYHASGRGVAASVEAETNLQDASDEANAHDMSAVSSAIPAPPSSSRPPPCLKASNFNCQSSDASDSVPSDPRQLLRLILVLDDRESLKERMGLAPSASTPLLTCKNKKKERSSFSTSRRSNDDLLRVVSIPMCTPLSSGSLSRSRSRGSRKNIRKRQQSLDPSGMKNQEWPTQTAPNRTGGPVMGSGNSIIQQMQRKYAIPTSSGSATYVDNSATNVDNSALVRFMNIAKAQGVTGIRVGGNKCTGGVSIASGQSFASATPRSTPNFQRDLRSSNSLDVHRLGASHPLGTSLRSLDQRSVLDPNAGLGSLGSRPSLASRVSLDSRNALPSLISTGSLADLRKRRIAKMDARRNQEWPMAPSSSSSRNSLSGMGGSKASLASLLSTGSFCDTRRRKVHTLEERQNDEWEFDDDGRLEDQHITW